MKNPTWIEKALADGRLKRFRMPESQADQFVAVAYDICVDTWYLVTKDAEVIGCSIEGRFSAEMHAVHFP